MTIEKSINHLNKRIQIPELYNRYIYILLLLILFSYIFSVFYNYEKLTTDSGTYGEVSTYLVISSIIIFFLALFFSTNVYIKLYSSYVLVLSLLILSISIFMLFLSYDRAEINADELADPITTGITFLFSYVLSSIFTHKGEL